MDTWSTFEVEFSPLNPQATTYLKSVACCIPPYIVVVGKSPLSISVQLFWPAGDDCHFLSNPIAGFDAPLVEILKSSPKHVAKLSTVLPAVTLLQFSNEIILTL